jgi:hypothetical protein
VALLERGAANVRVFGTSVVFYVVDNVDNPGCGRFWNAAAAPGNKCARFWKGIGGMGKKNRPFQGSSPAEAVFCFFFRGETVVCALFAAARGL